MGSYLLRFSPNTQFTINMSVLEPTRMQHYQMPFFPECAVQHQIHEIENLYASQNFRLRPVTRSDADAASKPEYIVIPPPR